MKEMVDNFLDNLRYLCSPRGTQAELHRRSGLTKAYISQLLSGQRPDFSAETACLISRHIGVPLGDLFDLKPGDFRKLYKPLEFKNEAIVNGRKKKRRASRA